MSGYLLQQKLSCQSYVKVGPETSKNSFGPSRSILSTYAFSPPRLMFHLLPPPLNRFSLAESSWRACQDRFRFETSESASEPLRLLSARGDIVGKCRRARGGRCSLVWQVYHQGQAGLRFSEIQGKCLEIYRLYFCLLARRFRVCCNFQSKL